MVEEEEREIVVVPSARSVWSVKDRRSRCEESMSVRDGRRGGVAEPDVRRLCNTVTGIGDASAEVVEATMKFRVEWGDEGRRRLDVAEVEE